MTAKKERRVALKSTGDQGVLTKVVNNCYWVKMDDGRELHGHASYWRKIDTK